MGNLSVIKQFELKEETLEADIDYFLNGNMDHIGFPRVFVVVCKLSCLQTLLYKVIYETFNSAIHNSIYLCVIRDCNHPL